ncbi:MAG: S8 family serine peptidase, partial [Actinobacteria bacterium]|nr:S8 family serine peptidase [Actinomycetota bacterium]
MGEASHPIEATPTNGLNGVVGRLVVQYEEGVGASEAPGVATGSESVEGIELAPEHDLGEGLRTVTLSEAVDEVEASKLIAQLEADTRVKWAEVDQIVTTAESSDSDPKDPLYSSKQWNIWSKYGVGGTQSHTASFGRTEAELGKGVTVAVIDTGIVGHADFGSRLLPGFDFVSDRSELRASRENDEQPVSFDGDYVDEDRFGGPGWDSNPLDPGDWRGVAPIRNSSWHGTHIAGIIGAEINNNKGIAGLVPLADLLPIRAISWRGGLSSDIAAAIIWASGGRVEGVPDNPNPAQVINLSFTANEACSETFQTAIDLATERGSVVAVAAGNANSDVRNYSPANCNGVVTVGATDATGKRAMYSNFGEGIDVSAPGGDLNANGNAGVYSLSNSGEREPLGDAYGYRQGTSVATAHVSAALARLAALYPDQSPGVLRALLSNAKSVRPFADGVCDTDESVLCGTGIVQIANVSDAPTSFTANNTPRSVALSWAAPTSASISGVRIRWGTSSDALNNQFDINSRTITSFSHVGTPLAVTARALSSNVATLTTSTAHGLAVGNSIVVSGIDNTFDGTFIIASVPSTTTFTYARVATNVTSATLTNPALVQRNIGLTIGQTYHYQIAHIFTDNTQSCTTRCISSYSTAISSTVTFSTARTFRSTGSPQQFVVPDGVSVLQFDAVGGAGGRGSASIQSVSRGGRVQGVLPVTAGETLYVYVGGEGGLG